ncbi:hypothetical protein BOM_1329 (plasmid) [Borrelia miyamotoi FR64b]|uniref:Uncharacterized protein n=1 Tax=Borrelia miyamotoi FR64b TaxID=1292392 RepID=W5SG54_9SPIR|nr:hypothetical protein BOM_1329 [Borrelia miyamotoi FR64b]
MNELKSNIKILITRLTDKIEFKSMLLKLYNWVFSINCKSINRIQKQSLYSIFL